MSTQCTTPNCVDVADSLHINQRAGRSTPSNSGSSRTLALVQRWLSNIKVLAVNRYEQHLDRLAFQQLLKLDEHMLKDIGITRGDVTYANNLPVSVDAAKEIECIARRNSTSRKH